MANGPDDPSDPLELDVDGDGVPDVVVPGLRDSPKPTSFDRGNTDDYEALAESNLPPTSNPMSPMGRIEQQGYALRNVMSRPSWRRTTVKVAAWISLGLVLAIVVVSASK
ncbi:MAG: hypothetical protein WCC60_15195 [Ilumatobacteraceae bacterium]